MNQPALIAFKAAADVTAKLAMFAVTVLAAHRLTTAAFGAFSLAVTFGWMLAVATDCGIQLHVARELARRPGESGAIVRRWLRLRAALTLAAAALVVAVAAGVQSPNAIAQAVIVLAYLVGGLVEFLYHVYRGLSRTDLESRLVLSQRLLMLVAAAVALTVAPRLDLLAVALLAPAIVALALSYRLAMRLAGTGRAKALRHQEAETRHQEAGTRHREADAGGIQEELRWRRALALPSRSIAREFRRDVLPIGAGIVFSALYFRLDVFLIQLWMGTEPVALYSAVFRLVDALRLFPAAVLAVMLPALCRATDPRPLIRVSLVVTGFALLVTLAGVALAPWTVTFVYGARYGEAAPAFRVLLLAFPLLSLNYALTHQLIAWNGHRRYAAVCAAAMAVNIALNFALLPVQGIVGAAWATIGTEIFLSAGCVWALARTRGRPREALPMPMAEAVSAGVSP